MLVQVGDDAAPVRDRGDDGGGELRGGRAGGEHRGGDVRVRGYDRAVQPAVAGEDGGGDRQNREGRLVILVVVVGPAGGGELRRKTMVMTSAP